MSGESDQQPPASYVPPLNDGSGKRCLEHSYSVIDSETTIGSRIDSLSSVLKSSPYNVTDDRLVKAIAALGEATAHIAVLLTNYVSHTYAGTQNTSGDEQLHLDIDCDNAVFAAVRNSGVYAIAASEETPVETDVAPTEKKEGEEDEEGGNMFSLGFDPLDGSSIIDANFSVGSIYGIWPGKGVLNRTGRDQVAAVVSMYGPRTTLCIGLPKSSSRPSPVVLELTLISNRTKWDLSRDTIQLQQSKKVFAPGNLRSTNDNTQYNELVTHWISERYTLRYTGGMVPDVYHMFAKGGGVFSNVSSDMAKAKLRLLYEVAPLGLIVECAGGMTTHEKYDGSVLDIKIDDLDKRLGVCFGSTGEVMKYKEFMFQTEQK